MRQVFRVPLVWACALLGLALLLSVGMFCRAWVRVRSGDELIRVVGSARKPIRSDFIIWSSSQVELLCGAKATSKPATTI